LAILSQVAKTTPLGGGLFEAAPRAEAASFFRIPSASTPALQPAKNLNPTGRGGGDITIVGGVALESQSGPSGTSADITDAKPSNGQISIYIVRSGDTISQIAKMFGVSPNTVIWANDLNRGNVIRPGDTLVILPVSGVEHIVRKGDTLASIAKKYGGDLDEVLSFNNISPGSSVAIGDTIVIPDGVEPQAAASGASRAPVYGTGGPVLVGYFLRPLVGGVRTQGLHGYNGIDIGAPVGTNVFASAGGKVIFSKSYGWNGGYGQYVVIEHPNGTQTLYSHLSKNYVSGGDAVSQGQLIGAVGKTGKVTGSHLHFEIHGAANPF